MGAYLKYMPTLDMHSFTIKQILYGLVKVSSQTLIPYTIGATAAYTYTLISSQKNPNISYHKR